MIKMRKVWYRRILINIALIVSFLGYLYYGPYGYKSDNQEVNTETVGENTVLLGGMPVGIYMETNGVMVLNTDAVEGADGIEYEPAENLVKPGDYITALNGEGIKNKKELISLIEELTDEKVVLHLRRGEEEVDVRVDAVAVKSREYKLGIWVRDDIQGLGTITFLTESSEFGALGHGIHDTDTGELVEIQGGDLYNTSIRSIIKGSSGSPGSMEGIIVYNTYNKIGEIDTNTEAGIYGKLDELSTLFSEQIPIEVGKKEEIELGDAKIRCYVDGEVKEYGIQILQVDVEEREMNKGMVIQITDQELLEKTGGIVQGMSGSPIIQNNRIIGAVTHVFVQDSTKGYGIFIENMLNTLK